MESLAYRVLQIGEIGSIILSTIILMFGAWIGVTLFKPSFKLKRAPYFAIYGLMLLLSSMTSLLALALKHAIDAGYLSVIVFLMFAALVPIGILGGVFAAARSLDGYGTTEKWFYAYIPFVNLALIFKATPDTSRSTALGYVSAFVLVLVGLLLIGAGRVIDKAVEQSIASLQNGMMSDPETASKLTTLELNYKGMEKFLKDVAATVPVPSRVDSITTLTRMETESDTLRYVYELSDNKANFGGGWNDMMMHRWCNGQSFKVFLDMGVTVEGVFTTQDQQSKGILRINRELCKDWEIKIESELSEAARKIPVPTKIDDYTTLVKADYSNSTFTYFYELPSAVPTVNVSSWLNGIRDSWCSSPNFGSMIEIGRNIRAVYTRADGVHVGDFTINTEACKTKWVPQ